MVYFIFTYALYITNSLEKVLVSFYFTDFLAVLKKCKNFNNGGYFLFVKSSNKPIIKFDKFSSARSIFQFLTFLGST